MFRRLSSARDAARRSLGEHREGQLREKLAAPKAVVELPLYRNLRNYAKTELNSLPHSIQGPILQVCILHIVLSNFESVSRSKPIEKLVPREIEVNVFLNPESARSLVYPRSRGILHGVSAAAKQDEWDVHVANKSNAMSVALHGDIKTP